MNNTKQEKTLASFIAWASDNLDLDKALSIAVIEHMGREVFLNYAEHVSSIGIAGSSGFTYHADTVVFYEKYKKIITESIKKQTEGLGEGSMIEHISSLYSNIMNAEISIDDTARLLYSADAVTDEKYLLFANVMAQSQGETVCRAYSDFVEANALDD